MTERDKPDELSERTAILEAIRELTAPSALTNTHFEAVVARHPELLSERALGVIEALLPLQDTPGARESLERIGAILGRAREVGIATAMIEFRIEHSPEDRARRLEDERRRLREARRTSPVRAPGGPGSDLMKRGRAFDSLGECLDHIRAAYPQDTISVQARDVASHSDEDSPLIDSDAPRFLFRGESGLFPGTNSSLARLRTDLTLSAESVETIIALAIRVRDQLVLQFGLAPRLAAGFVQHYGLPTDLLDVTPDLDVATQFATGLAIGDWGALGVLPVAPLLDMPDSVMFADLAHHPMADRPRRQSAYAFLDFVHSDLKDPAAIASRQIAWHWFRFTAEDEEAHQPDATLLDARSDRVAGLIELLINDCAKFDDGAARWIASRVPAAPMVVRVTGSDESGPTGILIPAEEAGEQVLGASAEANYRRWSSEFPEVEPPADFDPGALDTAAAETDIPTGATVWVLRSHVLQRPRRGEPDSQ